LQQHHRRDHPRRHRWAPQTRTREQIREIVITKQPITVLGQQPIHTARLQFLTQQQRRVIEPCLPIRPPNRHNMIFPTS
jgi:hypothetical protein